VKQGTEKWEKAEAVKKDGRMVKQGEERWKMVNQGEMKRDRKV
jgi:hypothetical protein